MLKCIGLVYVLSIWKVDVRSELMLTLGVYYIIILYIIYYIIYYIIFYYYYILSYLILYSSFPLFLSSPIYPLLFPIFLLIYLPFPSPLLPFLIPILFFYNPLFSSSIQSIRVGSSISLFIFPIRQSDPACFIGVDG